MNIDMPSVLTIVISVGIAITASITCLGAAVISEYVSVGNFMAIPRIISENKMSGVIVLAILILVPFSVFVNGWFLAGWPGVFALPVIFWFIIRPLINHFMREERGRGYSLVKNPTIQMLFGGIGLAILTLINIVTSCLQLG